MLWSIRFVKKSVEDSIFGLKQSWKVLFILLTYTYSYCDQNCIKILIGKFIAITLVYIVIYREFLSDGSYCNNNVNKDEIASREKYDNYQEEANISVTDERN